MYGGEYKNAHNVKTKPKYHNHFSHAIKIVIELKYSAYFGQVGFGLALHPVLWRGESTVELYTVHRCGTQHYILQQHMVTQKLWNYYWQLEQPLVSVTRYIWYSYT